MAEKMKVMVFGAGYYGKICKTYIEKSSKYSLLGFLDNAAEKPVLEDLGGESNPCLRSGRGNLSAIR